MPVSGKLRCRRILPGRRWQPSRARRRAGGRPGRTPPRFRAWPHSALSVAKACRYRAARRATAPLPATTTPAPPASRGSSPRRRATPGRTPPRFRAWPHSTLAITPMPTWCHARTPGSASSAGHTPTRPVTRRCSSLAARKFWVSRQAAGSLSAAAQRFTGPATPATGRDGAPVPACSPPRSPCRYRLGPNLNGLHGGLSRRHATSRPGRRMRPSADAGTPPSPEQATWLT